MKKLFILLILAAAFTCGWYCIRVNNRFFIHPSVETPKLSDIRIGAINIDGFRHMKDKRSCARKLLGIAQDNGIDILLIQEFMTSSKMDYDDFLAIFREQYPYTSIKGECAIASKLPVSEHVKVKFGDKYDYYSSAVVGEGDESVRVLAVHLRTTGLFRFNNGNDVSSKEDIKALVNELKENGAFRITQSETIAEAIQSSEMPVIVAGDFNCVPLSRVYRNIKACGMSDSFIEKGYGDGSTYRRLKGLFRIDYIFHDENFECIECKVLPDEISDHRMVTATLRKTKENMAVSASATGTASQSEAEPKQNGRTI